MCTIICTVRTVLWYVMSIAGTLMILVALFTNRWLEGHLSPGSLTSSVEGALDAVTNFGTNVIDGHLSDALERNVGLFMNCKVCLSSNLFFDAF